MSQKRIALIIEDDPDLSMIFTTALQDAGFETESIADGKTALVRLDERLPDVVVLDLQLPHVPGTKILQQIRSDSRLAQVKVIVATANPQLAGTVGELADLVLIKPISYSQLRDLAGRILS
ncbi:MAG: response regulator [Anaerolineae bacterium]|nr:response regulator [Anaerolineae bacterium]